MVGSVTRSGVGLQSPRGVIKHAPPPSSKTYRISTEGPGDERGDRKRLKIEDYVIGLTAKPANQVRKFCSRGTDPGEIDPVITLKQFRDRALSEEMNPGFGPELPQGVQGRCDKDRVTDPAPLISHASVVISSGALSGS